MYGTVARLKLKPGMVKSFSEYMEVEQEQIEGAVQTTLYQMDEDESILFMSVIFKDKESYRKNAESPESHERFLKMMELLETEPEWHDGDIVYHHKF